MTEVKLGWVKYLYSPPNGVEGWSRHRKSYRATIGNQDSQANYETDKNQYW